MKRRSKTYLKHEQLLLKDLIIIIGLTKNLTFLGYAGIVSKKLTLIHISNRDDFIMAASGKAG